MTIIAFVAIGLLISSNAMAQQFRLNGRVVDADSGQLIPARVYIRSATDEWIFVQSAEEIGTAIKYDEQWVPMPNSVDRHTTLSAHPFFVDLDPGEYEVTIERGKEYKPLVETITISDKSVEASFELHRWVNCAERGWYSGETHVHRRIHELPNVMLAEDLNVAFPVTFWTVRAYEPPGLAPSPLRRQGPSPHGPREDVGTKPIEVDATHVIVPRNTEFEVFNIGESRHVLGAMFVLNHKSIFQQGAPPVREIAEQAHREGALIDLDKHSWPWSMMLVAIADVDLYELANNSLWRTEFGFRNSSVRPAAYMEVEQEANAMTEWGWIQYGFENYYALLNCGFRLRPTAGTASGVHPVPLGFGRVYVYMEDSFSLDGWLAGLDAGRSFVTTGPMLFANLDGQFPGQQFDFESSNPRELSLSFEATSDRPITRIEVIVNGDIHTSIKVGDDSTESQVQTKDGVQTITASVSLDVSETSWVAVRAIQELDGDRVRFAHTAPWHIRVDDQPIRPKRVEVEYLIERMRREVSRSEELISEKALEEYREALSIFESLRENAR